MQLFIFNNNHDTPTGLPNRKTVAKLASKNNQTLGNGCIFAKASFFSWKSVVYGSLIFRLVFYQKAYTFNSLQIFLKNQFQHFANI